MNQLIALALCCVTYSTAAPSEGKFRITTGDVTVPGEVPYQVSLQINGQHNCGGSLISKMHVLTAAHCVHSIILNPAIMSLLKISVGTNRVPGSGQIHSVARIAIPKAYDAKTFTADISVIRLSQPVQLSDKVKIIKLPVASLQLTEGQTFFVSGFGTSRLDGILSSVLKKIKMTAVSHVGCQKSLQQFQLNAGLFCAATANGDGVCKGDSGGPVTLNQQTIVGVVSAVSSRGCGSGIPDLFTRVTTYIQFIRNEMAITN